MKKIYLLLAVPLLFAACQQKTSNATTSAALDTVKYAYTIPKPDN